MEKRARTAKVLISLVISMTIGAIVLMSLDNHCPSAGPFSLASYTSLNPVDSVASKKDVNLADWDNIEVYYSRTSANSEQLSKLSEMLSGNNANFHFFICNGLYGSDGSIQSTEKWRRQDMCQKNKGWLGQTKTIRICVIADGESSLPTDCQIQRTAALVDTLSRKFNISPKDISFPSNWKM